MVRISASQFHQCVMYAKLGRVVIILKNLKDVFDFYEKKYLIESEFNELLKKMVNRS